MQCAKDLSEKIGRKDACAAVGVPRSSLYRAEKPRPVIVRISPRALSAAERDSVRDTLNSPRFQDLSPREVYATLLDEDKYLCSWRSMYRVLDENGEVRERRDQLRHPNYAKPELLATAPNQLWSWDITKLLGPTKWTYFYLYAILDVFSRYVVGWMIAERESATLAEELITQTCARQGIKRGQLTIHADRGSAMTSKTVAMLLADLGVTKTHSRPHVSNDNPYSEAQFKTLKYRPDYPSRFGSRQDARTWATAFFDWYNNEHHHTGIALLTPADVHFNRAQAVLQKRQETLRAAYERHPERFVKGRSAPASLPPAVWINPPVSQSSPQNKNENNHCKSVVPVSFGGTLIVPEFPLRIVAPIQE
jgi:putative transposase